MTQVYYQREKANEKKNKKNMLRFDSAQRLVVVVFIRPFTLPHFYYCSMVWYFSSKQDFDKLDL